MVKDVVRGTLLAGITDNAVGEVINIASEKENTVKEIAEIIVKMTNSESNIIHLEPLKGDPKRNKANTEKAANILKFEAEYTLERGIEYIYKRLF